MNEYETVFPIFGESVKEWVMQFAQDEIDSMVEFFAGEEEG